MGLSFKSHFKDCRLAQWYRVGFVKSSERSFWFEYGQNIFFLLFKIVFIDD